MKKDGWQQNYTLCPDRIQIDTSNSLIAIEKLV
jgi:hypothetical protein